MPLQVIDTTDPLTDMVALKASPVFELMISLHTLLKPGRHQAWVASARAALPDAFLSELEALYEPHMKGMLFLELAVDFADHDDVPGFVEYVRHMPPAHFLFYLFGRILPPEDIAATGYDLHTVRTALDESDFDTYCKCSDVPLGDILADVPAFQARLADLWQWYWDSYFAAQVPDLAPRWQYALNDKIALLQREGGQRLYEDVTGHTDLLPPLPADYPVQEIVFIPIYLLPSSRFMFYGYGNITVLFDSERTAERMAEIERNKDRALVILKALGDNSRLEILRLVAHYEGMMHGKKIAESLKLSASAVSRHLGQLKDAGLIVEESQDNRTISYRLQEDAIATLPQLVLDYLQH